MKFFLSALFGLFIGSTASAKVYNCYQDSYAQNAALLNATIRTGGGVISVSLSTVTPGSAYSAQLHILSDLEESVSFKEADVNVLYSEGKHMEFPGFINKIKGTIDLNIERVSTDRLTLTMKQDLGGWPSEWKTDCSIVSGTSH